MTGIIGMSIMALIIGSVFYNLPHTTSALYSRGALLFFAILMAAFQSGLEVSVKYTLQAPNISLLNLVDLNIIRPKANS